jgi:hypothetical protein
MGITYRSDGPWGPGKGSDLAPVDVDNNFWQLVQDVTAKAVQGVGIANFHVVGDQMTVVLTDHTLLGPYTLPVVPITFGGAWLPLTQYYANTIITHGGTTYIVLANHVSAATFDPGANNGAGQDYYSVLLQSPASALPTGGAPGMALLKATTADFSTLWKWLTLAGLTDVDQSISPHNGDLIAWNGRVFSYLPQAAIASAISLEQLTDVALGSPLETGQPLFYNGADFTNTSTVDLPYHALTAAAGAVTINRALGEIQDVTLVGNVTLSITGWPGSSQFARLVIRITNPGTYTVAWPAGTKWPGANVPTVTSSGTDLVIFTSFNGGATVYGSMVGQDFR